MDGACAFRPEAWLLSVINCDWRRNSRRQSFEGTRMELTLINVSAFCDEAVFREALSVVGQERAAAVGKLRTPEAKRLSLGAGLLLRHALCCHGLTPDSVRIASGKHGKPYLPDFPDICFNLSHSGEYALCAVSDCPVGCDIEQIAEPELRVAERFFAPSEYALLLTEQDPDKRRLFFYRLWTLKESFLKATGLGLTLPLNRFSVDPDTLTVCQSADDRTYRFREYETCIGYRIAVCSAFDEFPCEPRVYAADAML